MLMVVKHRVEQKLEQMGRVQGVKLHTAHMLCMDAILNVGLEMGSHNHDCWPHVFRYVFLFFLLYVLLIFLQIILLCLLRCRTFSALKIFFIYK